MSKYAELRDKIETKTAVVAVIGLGYVGLPAAIAFHKNGFKVFGLDIDKNRIKKLKEGKSYLNDISSAEVKKIVSKRNFSVTTNESILREADVIIICVPTPLNKMREPDISSVVNASEAAAANLTAGQLIILESTTYPGTTREVILPILSKSGLRHDRDFFLVFSPERIDPGNEKYDFTNIPKVIGGFTPEGTELAKLLYENVVDKVVCVSSPETAETTKLLENTFRLVNIALMNEFANLCHKLDADVWEVIKAARTKPFGFMPFYPGPGIGGHCIPADPIYLSWKARKVGFETKMIDLAAEVNLRAPRHVIERAEKMLVKRGRKIKGARVLVLGAAYKKNVNDLRDSPAIDIMELLLKKGAALSYHDPFAPVLRIGRTALRSNGLSKDFLKGQDLVIVVTDHDGVNYRSIASHSRMIFDARNVFERNGIVGDNIVKL